MRRRAPKRGHSRRLRGAPEGSNVALIGSRISGAFLDHRRRAAAAAAVLLGVWPAAGLAEKKPPPPIPSNWVTMPAPSDWSLTRPRGFAPGMFARAVAKCAVNDAGALTGCRIVREAPTGIGAGEALLSLAPRYQRKPPGADGAREVSIVGAWYAADQQGDWVKKPTAADLMAVFPTEAYRRGINGQATIDCVSTVQGALTDCVAIEESPAGAGFGSAAIALTAQFLMKPARYHGAPVQSVARIPIRFITYGPADVGESKKVLPANLPWSQAPTYAELAAAYPKKARAEKKAGRATLACEMSETGKLRDCVVAASEPKGYGFDVAAKGLARTFTFPVNSDSDKKATHAVVVHLPFTFDPATLDEATPVVGKPSWATIPNDDQLRTAFAAVKVSGTVRVMLKCIVQPGGSLGDCSVGSEEPAGAGVGAAALALVPTFRVTTWTAEGLPVVGGAIRIPLRYEGAK